MNDHFTSGKSLKLMRPLRKTLPRWREEYQILYSRKNGHKKPIGSIKTNHDGTVTAYLDNGIIVKMRRVR